ncbi:MAG: diacylglycerol kinase family lipid kinase [Chlorobi bacterium]|nr:diacylglycerol kinase family lipid kinase [Chlorobiota bacterium]
MKKGYLAIVNPNAGTGKGKKDWPVIERLLNDNRIIFHTVFTKARGHAIDIVTQYARLGYNRILVVGGDGTLNEVINGVFAQQYIPTTEIQLAMIAVGTGNDWSKMFSIPGNYKDAIHTIAKNRVIYQDVGKVKYFISERQRSRYFINIAGMGFDAVVTKKSNFQKEKGKSGKLTYFYNLITSLFSYKHINSSISVDNNHAIKDDIFSMNVGICKFSGGGMMQVPNAIADDGLFDMTIIKKMGKLEVIRNISKLYDGTLINHPKVDSFRGKTIRIQSDDNLKLEVDGESLGHAPFHFDILQQSIGIVVGDEAYFQSKIKPVFEEKAV